MSSIAYAIPIVLVTDESIRRRLAMLPSPVTEMLAISLPMAARFRTSMIRASVNWFARARLMMQVVPFTQSLSGPMQ
jgi:hypothetical protein